MPDAAVLIWISGASGAIGRALVETVPWPQARIIGIGRRPAPGTEHLEADLADPASWPRVGESFRQEMASTGAERIVFVHAAGTLDPIGFAGEVEAAAYTRSVVLNSAAPQVLGHLYLEAVREARGDRHLVMITSGAASAVYEGWSSYGAGKAAIDAWVRDAGAEQARRGGVRVLAVAPGPTASAMQEQIRATPEDDFPQRPRFADLHESGRLGDPQDIARRIWALLGRDDVNNGSVVDVREPPASPGR